MGRLDDKFRDKVPAILARFRDTTDLLTSKFEDYNFATGENIPDYLGPWTVTASPALDYYESEIDGTTVRRGDKRVIIAARSLNAESPAVVPTTQNHGYTKGSLDYEIVNVKTIEAGDTTVAYELQLRR